MNEAQIGPNDPDDSYANVQVSDQEQALVEQDQNERNGYQ